MDQFATKLRAKSVPTITVALLAQMRVYQSGVVDELVYGCNSQKNNGRLMEEIRSIDHWLKKHSKKLN